jgi:hypothetical protein
MRGKASQDHWWNPIYYQRFVFLRAAIALLVERLTRKEDSFRAAG